ncbi:hypothetical protein SLUDD06_00273 [Streptococcus lutetiensis]|nr:hypothetical protein SLUDD06_00273 [Streptococcus lutetiensis]
MFSDGINFNYKSSLSILWTSSHFTNAAFCSAVNDIILSFPKIIVKFLTISLLAFSS